MGSGNLVQAWDGEFVGAEAEGETGDGDGVAFSAAQIRGVDVETNQEFAGGSVVHTGAPAW
jgi:hypothetical protein